MPRTVNLAIQFLPLHLSQAEAYRIIDAAIAVVQASGLEHVVSPFETVLEGSYEEVMEVFNAMQDAAFRAGAGELLINSKLHRSASRSLHLTDKTGKYA